MIISTFLLYYRYIVRENFTYFTDASEIPNQLRLLFYYQA